MGLISSQSINTLILRVAAKQTIMLDIMNLLARVSFTHLRRLDIYLAPAQVPNTHLVVELPYAAELGLDIHRDSGLAKRLERIRLYIADMSWVQDWDELLGLFGDAHVRRVTEVLPMS
jgi:hypothetical protein